MLQFAVRPTCVHTNTCLRVGGGVNSCLCVPTHRCYHRPSSNCWLTATVARAGGVLCFVAGIAKFTPQDATTNPSLVKAAAMMDKYKHVVDDAVAYGKANASEASEQLDLAMDKLVSQLAS
jgi:hypothetical protein